MKKRICILINFVLLSWFFLDMIGLNINGHLLVSKAYKEDGVFFVIYIVLIGLYLFKPKYGYYLLTGWLFMWFATQFMSHWYYTIIGSGEDKIAYFSNTIKLIHSTEHYIPDLYHIVLHLLILVGLLSMIIFGSKSKKE